MNEIQAEASAMQESLQQALLWSHEMVHLAFVGMMDLVRDWGYGGVAFLMALESSIVPIPSEVVIPPAAYWASKGQLNLPLVLVAGTLGSWLGSAITYWVSYALGRPLVLRYGKYVGFSQDKVAMAEDWVKTFGTEGIFFARLLPVIRHLISIPAGICRMPFKAFSAATVLGAGIWCSILSWFGPRIITEPMLEDATKMVSEIKSNMHHIMGLIFLIAILYGLRIYMTRRSQLGQKQKN